MNLRNISKTQKTVVAFFVFFLLSSCVLFNSIPSADAEILILNDYEVAVGGTIYANNAGCSGALSADYSVSGDHSVKFTTGTSFNCKAHVIYDLEVLYPSVYLQSMVYMTTYPVAGDVEGLKLMGGQNATGSSSANGPACALAYTTAGGVHCWGVRHEAPTGTFTTHYNESATFTTNTWYRVEFRLTPDAMYLYVDGVLVYSESTFIVNDGYTRVRFGMIVEHYAALIVYMDDVKVSTTYIGDGSNLGPEEDYIDLNNYELLELDELGDLSQMGTQSNLTAQKFGPDLINDTLTEKVTHVYVNTTYFFDGFESGNFDQWTDGGTTTWQMGTNSTPSASYPTHSGTYQAYCGPANDGKLETDNIDTTNATAVFISFWYKDDDLDAGDFLFNFFSGTSYYNLYDLETVTGEDTWIYHGGRYTGSGLMLNKTNFRVQFNATPENGEYAYIDDVQIVVEQLLTANHSLNFEEQFIDANYTRTNEELCIYTGNMNVTDGPMVYVRNGSSWVWLMNLTAYQWNNASVSSYLTSSVLSIRFTDGGVSPDPIRDSYQIDACLLHTWFGTPDPTPTPTPTEEPTPTPTPTDEPTETPPPTQEGGGGVLFGIVIVGTIGITVSSLLFYSTKRRQVAGQAF